MDAVERGSGGIPEGEWESPFTIKDCRWLGVSPKLCRGHPTPQLGRKDGIILVDFTIILYSTIGAKYLEVSLKPDYR